jgi:hypothetical protein
MTFRTMGIVLCIGALAGCSKKAASPPAPEPAPKVAAAPAAPPSGTVAEDTVTATATVQKINMKTRHVTLKGEDGKTVTIVAGPEVRNLAQVKRGDVVRMTYHESIAYQVQKAGTAKPGAGAGTDVSRAPLGEKPSGKVTNTVNVRATIAEINKSAGTVTLRGPEGNLKTIKARDPSKLDQVQVGDLVDIKYTEALAVSVEKASKK